ncbi:nuclease-related domain-containing protein [Brevundimonas diminuta]|nr:nuclease-related domain-containing protein [Brevundimonas diminuta]
MTTPSSGDLQAAIRALDPAPLVAELERPDATEDDAQALVTRLVRSSSLVMPRTTASREARRIRFLDSLSDALADRFGADLLKAFERTRSQLAIAESGYRTVLAAFDRTAYAALPLQTRLSALLVRSAATLDQAFAETMAEAARNRVVAPQSISLRDAFGRPIPPDAIVDGVVELTTSTLIMETFKARHLADADGGIRLPALAPPGDDAVFTAGSNEHLALVWRHWRRLEERARFLDGELLRDDDAPLADAPEITTLLQSAVPAKERFYAWAAEHRRNDGLAQDYMATAQNRALVERIGDFDAGMPLVPQAFTSLGEITSTTYLSETLCQPIGQDHEEVDGLRVVEWLRGFSALGVLAERHLNQPDPGALHPRLAVFDRAVLKAALTRNGLTSTKATLFLEAATLRTDSLDLFNAPLIRMQDGRMLAFGPSLIGANPAGILMSVFAERQISFERKGRLFEHRVLSLFADSGLEAVPFKTSLGGDQYEYDALLAWGDYVFLFECKNRSLPGEHAVPVGNFHSEIRKQVRQVERLRQALTPEWLGRAFGRPMEGKSVVPVVLNNLPYARLEPLDGVLFYDFQALRRFFSSAAIRANWSFDAGDGERLTDGMDTVRLWTGKAPTPEDLLAQLKSPLQLTLTRDHTSLQTMTLPLDETTAVASQEHFREEQTVLTLARLAGIPGHVIRARMEKTRKRAAKLRDRKLRQIRL